jgi:Flp pilus assembly protein TadG
MIAQRSINLRPLWRDRRGSYSMMTALLLPVLAGFAAFGSEVSLWFYNHQTMQGAADAAAYGAALSYSLGNTTNFTAEAKAVAAKYGFTDGSGGTVVTVNRPPTTGSHTSIQGAVEVIVQQSQTRLLSAALTGAPMTIKARAVAAGTAGQNACVLGLDSSASQTVTLSNNALLPDKNCGVASNSTSTTGLYLSNNAIIDGPTSSSGGTVVSNNAVLGGTSNVTNAPPIADPYAASNPPATPSTCTSQNGSGSGVPRGGPRNFVPDSFVNGVGVTRFCSGLSFTNNFAANFAPGVYYIDSALTFGNNAVITGSGVTLVINGNYAINIGNNASVTLTAPTSGPTQGIVFTSGRTADSTVTQTFSNNTILNLTGAIYFPNQTLQFDNNGSTVPGSGCTQLVARKIQLMNNVDLSANCGGTGVKPITFGGSLALVE